MVVGTGGAAIIRRISARVGVEFVALRVGSDRRSAAGSAETPASTAGNHRTAILAGLRVYKIGTCQNENH